MQRERYCNDSVSLTLQTPLGGIKGIVRDVENNDVFEFRKIPFAKPPIGKLRFEKPEKYGIWPGTLDDPHINYFRL
jgi:carboxylesterase type B